MGERIQWPRPEEPERKFTFCGGFEIIGALAIHLGWAQQTARVIVQERERFRRTAAYEEERVNRDRKGRNAQGQFTGEYNRRKEIRHKRFASVEVKREDKNYSRMGLFQAGEFILERKCLGILALPLITLNGSTRSANGPLGNALEAFCGYNYQHDTLDKFLRELKYLGTSDLLLRDQVSFWQGHWRNFEGSPSWFPFLCYYVDGNTKPLWSEKRVKQSKVTMLGRVMGCLEQVFVHDGFGHPVYLETYAGKAPAVRIDWDTGKRTVLITSLPKETVGASLVVKAYFDRWPNEELQFRSMKSFACLNWVAGYGKRRLPDEKVRKTQKELQARITKLRQSLRIPLKAIADQEERLAACIEKERRIHSQCQVVDGKRVVDEQRQVMIKSYSSEMAQCRRQIKSIESEWGKDLHRLRRYEREWLRLQGKDYVYRIDVELDQIMTYFRVLSVSLRRGGPGRIGIDGE
jgi:hypothetical protein